MDSTSVSILNQVVLSLPRHLKTWAKNWPTWFQSLTLAQKVLPAGLMAAYLAVIAMVGHVTPDHISMTVLILVLSYTSRASRVLLGFLLPLLLTGIVYDSQRYYSDLIRGRIRVEEPYLFDKTFFGIPTAQGVLTPNEWWQLHIHPVLDLITGFFYLTFILIYFLICAYFRFYLIRKGTPKTPQAAFVKKLPAMMWSFFWVNLLGYSTYYWYPAAPPWYVSMYGLGPARLDVPANPAGCLRFDEILGTHFFTGMYGRAADVFGAIPSLHVAYPFLAVYFSMRLGAARAFSWAFYLVMCFSAVYLNHHYILDILWGTAYALLIGIVLEWYFTRRMEKAEATL